MGPRPRELEIGSKDRVKGIDVLVRKWLWSAIC